MELDSISGFFLLKEKNKFPSLPATESIWNLIRASTADTIMYFEFKSLIDVRFIWWPLPPENKHQTKTKILFETVARVAFRNGFEFGNWIRSTRANTYLLCIVGHRGYTCYVIYAKVAFCPKYCVFGLLVANNIRLCILRCDCYYSRARDADQTTCKLLIFGFC